MRAAARNCERSCRWPQRLVRGSASRREIGGEEEQREKCPMPRVEALVGDTADKQSEKSFEAKEDVGPGEVEGGLRVKHKTTVAEMVQSGSHYLVGGIKTSSALLNLSRFTIL